MHLFTYSSILILIFIEKELQNENEDTEQFPTLLYSFFFNFLKLCFELYGTIPFGTSPLPKFPPLLIFPMLLQYYNSS